MYVWIDKFLYCHIGVESDFVNFSAKLNMYYINKDILINKINFIIKNNTIIELFKKMHLQTFKKSMHNLKYGGSNKNSKDIKQKTQCVDITLLVWKERQWWSCALKMDYLMILKIEIHVINWNKVSQKTFFPRTSLVMLKIENWNWNQGKHTSLHHKQVVKSKTSSSHVSGRIANQCCRFCCSHKNASPLKSKF